MTAGKCRSVGNNFAIKYIGMYFSSRPHRLLCFYYSAVCVYAFIVISRFLLIFIFLIFHILHRDSN